MTIVLSGFGAGLTCGACVLKSLPICLEAFGYPLYYAPVGLVQEK